PRSSVFCLSVFLLFRPCGPDGPPVPALLANSDARSRCLGASNRYRPQQDRLAKSQEKTLMPKIICKPCLATGLLALITFALVTTLSLPAAAQNAPIPPPPV